MDAKTIKEISKIKVPLKAIKERFADDWLRDLHSKEKMLYNYGVINKAVELYNNLYNLSNNIKISNKLYRYTISCDEYAKKYLDNAIINYIELRGLVNSVEDIFMMDAWASYYSLKELFTQWDKISLTNYSEILNYLYCYLRQLTDYVRPSEC